MKNDTNKKMYYVLVMCMLLSFLVIGGTFAYFTAKASDNTTVRGEAEATTFGVRIEKITDVDMAFGLIPMLNKRSSNAAATKCKDTYGNAVCQIYRVTAKTNSDMVMFMDGYILTETKETLETRIAAVYTNDEEENFYTEYREEDFINNDTLNNTYFTTNEAHDLGIKTGACTREDNRSLNHTQDSDCLIISNKQIGGDAGEEQIYYFMIWVFDNGENQNELQGLELAYHGTLVFVTAEGNEISATFD